MRKSGWNWVVFLFFSFFFRGKRERERVIGSWWHTLMARWKKTAFLLIRLKIRDDSDRGWLERVASRSASASNEREDGRCLTRDQSGWWKGNENPWDIENREYFYTALQVGNKTEIFSKFFFLSLECTPRSRFKRMIYRVERCRFDEQEKKSCKKLQCSPPVSTGL